MLRLMGHESQEASTDLQALERILPVNGRLDASYWKYGATTIRDHSRGELRALHDPFRSVSSYFSHHRTADPTNSESHPESADVFW